MVTIKTCEGLCIRNKGLDYQGLKNIGGETGGLVTIDVMDDMQIREFALFLYEVNQKKSKQLDEMIARLDEIGKDLKEARKELKEIRMQIVSQSEGIKKTKRPCLNTKCLRNTRSLKRNTMIFLIVFLRKDNLTPKEV